MSVATSTAIIIGSGIAAGTQIYGAHKAASAAKKASEQQQAAAHEAIAYAEPRYQQALQIAQQQAELGRAGLQPYNAAGTSSMTALTALLGLPAAASGGGMNRATAMPPPGSAGPLQPPYTRPGGGGPPGTPTGAVAVPRAGMTGATVMLRAPTGQVQAVPADHVDFYLARGAQRV